jgi:hypothetical protein
MNVIAEIVHSVIARGDLAHLALALWAATEFAVLFLVLRELGAANRRFDDFVRELSRFNGRYEAISDGGGATVPPPGQRNASAGGPVIQNPIHQQFGGER